MAEPPPPPAGEMSTMERLKQKKEQQERQAAAAAAEEALAAGPPAELTTAMEKLRWKKEQMALIDAAVPPGDDAAALAAPSPPAVPAGGAEPPQSPAAPPGPAAEPPPPSGSPSPAAAPEPGAQEEGGDEEDVPVQTEAGKMQGNLKRKGFGGQGGGWQKQWCVLMDGKLTCYNDKDARTLFDEMDADGSGALDASEIKELCKLMKFKLKNQALKAAMEEMDTDGSGEVEFEEFEAWWSTAAGKKAAARQASGEIPDLREVSQISESGGVRGFELTMAGGKASYAFESTLSKDKNAEIERDQWLETIRGARQALLDADAAEKAAAAAELAAAEAEAEAARKAAETPPPPPPPVNNRAELTFDPDAFIPASDDAAAAGSEAAANAADHEKRGRRKKKAGSDRKGRRRSPKHGSSRDRGERDSRHRRSRERGGDRASGDGRRREEGGGGSSAHGHHRHSSSSGRDQRRRHSRHDSASDDERIEPYTTEAGYEAGARGGGSGGGRRGPGREAHRGHRGSGGESDSDGGHDGGRRRHGRGPRPSSHHHGVHRGQEHYEPPPPHRGRGGGSPEDIDPDFQPLLYGGRAAAMRLHNSLRSQQGLYYGSSGGHSATVDDGPYDPERAADTGGVRRRQRAQRLAGGSTGGVSWGDDTVYRDSGAAPLSSGMLPEHRPVAVPSLLSEFRTEAAATASTIHSLPGTAHLEAMHGPFAEPAAVGGAAATAVAPPPSSSLPPEKEWEERAVLVQADSEGGGGGSSSGGGGGGGVDGLVCMNKYLRAGWRVKISTPCRSGMCWLVIVHRPRHPDLQTTHHPLGDHSTGAGVDSSGERSRSPAEHRRYSEHHPLDHEGRGGSYTAAHLPKHLARPNLSRDEQEERERRWAIPRREREQDRGDDGVGGGGGGGNSGDSRRGGGGRDGAVGDIYDAELVGGGRGASRALDGSNGEVAHVSGAQYWAREEEVWRRHEEEAAMELAIGRGRRGGLAMGAAYGAAMAAREKYERWGRR